MIFRVGFLFIYVSFLSYGQILTLTDKANGEPVEFASISGTFPPVVINSDEKGQADISELKGRKRIIIRRMGYKTLVFSYSDLQAMSFNLAMQPAPLQQYERVVSGTRWQQEAKDVPAKVDIISSHEVSFQNPQTAADLLKISGDVFIQKSQQGGGSPMIRGFATNRLLYSVDGVRMNTAIFRGGNLQNVISLDPFATESTEVLFGPGSVIYGSDAIGGVMSFQTLTPRFSYTEKTLVTGKSLARYSTANEEKTAHFDVNVGGRKWALITSMSSFDYDNLRQGSHGPDDYIKDYFVERIDNHDAVITQDDPLVQIPSAYSQSNFMQKVRYSPNDELDFQFGFHYSETSPYGRYDRHNRVRNDLPRYGQWNYGPQTWMMNHLMVNSKHPYSAWDEWTLRLAVQNFEESRIDRSLNSPTRHIRTENVDAYSLNFDLKKQFGEKNELFYGVEFVSDDVRSRGVDEDITTGDQQPGPSRYPQSTWRSMAAYINWQHESGEQLLTQASLRYNRYQLNADFDNTFYPFPFQEADLANGALTGSVGLVYRPTDKWVISGNLSTGFRAPNVDDMGKVFDSEPGSVVIPNPDLRAEYAYNADFSIATIVMEATRLNLSCYYTKLDHAMVRRDYNLNGEEFIEYEGVLSRVQAIQNAADAHVYGLQAGIQIKLPYHFDLISDFNYQKGEEELDDGTVSPSRHAAPWFGVTRISYDSSNLRLQFYSEYQGKKSHEDMAIEEQGKEEIYAKDENGNTYAPSWYTLNIKASYKLSDLFFINAGFENLTDQRYRPYSSGISGAGRNFVFSVEAIF